MKNREKILIYGLVLIGMSACGGPVDYSTTGKVAGGGWFQSKSGIAGDKANFGFNAARCQFPGPVSGTLNYHDKNAPGYHGGVKFVGTIKTVSRCVASGTGTFEDTACLSCPTANTTPPAGSAGYAITLSYSSTNPTIPGSGDTALVCLADNGEGKNATAKDALFVSITSGPYNGYTNQGSLGGGNIQSLPCTCTDGIDNNGNGLIDANDPKCHDPITGVYDPNRDEN